MYVFITTKNFQNFKLKLKISNRTLRKYVTYESNHITRLTKLTKKHCHRTSTINKINSNTYETELNLDHHQIRSSLDWHNHTRDFHSQII